MVCVVNYTTQSVCSLPLYSHTHILWENRTYSKASLVFNWESVGKISFRNAFWCQDQQGFLDNKKVYYNLDNSNNWKLEHYSKGCNNISLPILTFLEEGV